MKRNKKKLSERKVKFT